MRSLDRRDHDLWNLLAGVRAAAHLPLRPEGVAAAAHIIGYKLVIRLLPKLDLTSVPCSNAAARRCDGAFAL